jgi:DNA processing protein
MTPQDLLGPLNAVEKRNAPEILFVAGHLSVLQAGPRVSVVGARKASPDGIKRASKLARLLVSRNVTVVSGLAMGIDTAAHESAIRHGGRTIAVLGTPLNVSAVRANERLQDDIMRHHLAISEFPLGATVQRHNFVQRNRTMALIVDASVIVEASDSSGSLSQGWEALRLGRPLFITKSVADDPALHWPAELRDYGAQVLTDDGVEALFECLPVAAREAAVGELLSF